MRLLGRHPRQDGLTNSILRTSFIDAIFEFELSRKFSLTPAFRPVIGPEDGHKPF
jgi:hypothetical protein